MPRDQNTHPDLPGIPVKLAAPARRALANAGITTLEQLRSKTCADVAALHGMGPSALKRLRKALSDKGWSFAPER